MGKLETIQGIGENYAGKLNECGVTTTESLLDKGASASGRKELVEKTGISSKLILRWVNMTDLFRIKGVGEEYADLLEAAGVDTIPELAQRNAGNLQVKMAQINDEKSLVRSVPSQTVVEGWVAQAKGLDRVVTH